MFVEIETEECKQRLDASFVGDEQIALIQGERKRLELWVSNTGVEDVSEIWMVSGSDNTIWIGESIAEKSPGESIATKTKKVGR